MRINSTLYYLLKDHLGSASVVTDGSGTIVGEDRFYPYGETRFTTGTMYTDKLFTGQREMTGLGIYHYGARFYSPKLGRFLSPDTIVPGTANPQAFNRYSYVLGNPLRYVDPSGHGQCQTQEECNDMGTTPMGTGGSSGESNGSGGNSGGGDADPDWEDLDNSGYTDWEIQILQELYNNGGSDAMHGVWYIINNGIHITVGEALTVYAPNPNGDIYSGNWQSIYDVSGWYEGNDYVVLNPNSGYKTDDLPDNWGLATIIHEALHIEQGGFFGGASTKDSELAAYQTGLRVYMTLEGTTLSQLDIRTRLLYNSKSGWEYGQNVKKYEPGYWQGLRLLPPYWP